VGVRGGWLDLQDMQRCVIYRTQTGSTNAKRREQQGSLNVHKILQKPGVRMWNGFSWRWSPGGNFCVPSKVGNFSPIPAGFSTQCCT
jgi:hypothetical protein